jgi:hypothetical protein
LRYWMVNDGEVDRGARLWFVQLLVTLSVFLDLTISLTSSGHYSEILRRKPL